MKNIGVVTGTRAEYSLLKPTMNLIKEDENLKLSLIVTGSHLSKKFGKTINEIISDGFYVDEYCPILLDYEGKEKNAKEMGIAINELANSFVKLKIDILLILGDRYEALAAAITAMTMNIPIAHISGGEVTEGAVDEQIRHSITKLSHIHFPGAVEYKENIIKMGEESWRVFNVGDPGVENIKKTKFLSKEKLFKVLGIEINDQTLLITYHPVTLEYKETEKQINELICALKKINKEMIITYPNADNGGEKIIEALEKFSLENPKVHLYKSLGSLNYLSVMKYCGAIIGNSSSGIVESPIFKKPAINIGNRQKGRLMAENIINVSNESDDIYRGIVEGLSDEFKEKCKNVKNLYGEGNTSKEIIKILKNLKIDEKLLKKKLSW